MSVFHVTPAMNRLPNSPQHFYDIHWYEPVRSFDEVRLHNSSGLYSTAAAIDLEHSTGDIRYVYMYYDGKWHPSVMI